MNVKSRLIGRDSVSSLFGSETISFLTLHFYFENYPDRIS